MEVKPITDVNYVTEKLSVEWLFIKNLIQKKYYIKILIIKTLYNVFYKHPKTNKCPKTPTPRNNIN